MWRWLWLLLFSALAVTVAAATPAAAQQQPRDERPFLMRLFGFSREAPPPAPPEAGPRIIRVPSTATRRPSVQPVRRTAPRTATSPAIITTSSKNGDARLVLVIGDRLAGYLGSGLDVAFADRPDVAFEVKAVPQSGLTDPTAIDWKGWLGQRFEEPRRPEAVVVMLGLEDAKPVRLGDREVAYPSPDWETIYKARIDALIRVASDHHVPLFWVGLLPVADSSATNDLSYVDSLIHAETTQFGASYVDVWDAFARSGAFSFSGPDIDGQDRQLRLKDGIGFTRSGGRKLAFFAEQGIRAWLSATASSAELLDKVSADGYVMLLNDPAAAVDDELMETAALRQPRPGTALYRLVVEGLPLKPVAGRIDDPQPAD